MQEAVAAFRRRQRRPAKVDCEEVLRLFGQFEPIPLLGVERLPAVKSGHVWNHLHPGQVAAALRELTERGDFEKADELALRAHHAAVASWGCQPPARAFYKHLVHVVRREK